MVSNTTGLEYNSNRENLLFPEYGRHVQKLINHAKTIVDLEERQVFVETIIDLMHQMNPQNKNVIEYRLRLWRHLFKIADYEINVAAPEGVPITALENEPKRVKLDYPKSNFKFRHYGSVIQEMVAKAIAMEDEEMRAEFAEVIASYMKLAYRTWNREHYVNDEIIKADLVKLSKGKLELAEDYQIENLTNGAPKRQYKRGSSGGRKNNRSNNKKGRNNSRGRKR